METARIPGPFFMARRQGLAEPALLALLTQRQPGSGSGLGRCAVRAGQSDEERFGEPKVISDPLPEGFAGACFPHLALDGQGNSYMLFELLRAGVRRGYGMSAP